MDDAIKTLLDQLAERVVVNTREVARVATLIETTNSDIEHSFMSAGRDFGLVAEAVAELHADISALRTVLSTSSEMFGAELHVIKTELDNLQLTKESDAGQQNRGSNIVKRILAIEKHLGIADEIAA